MEITLQNLANIATIITLILAFIAIFQIFILMKTMYAENFKWIANELDDLKDLQKKLLANKRFLDKDKLKYLGKKDKREADKLINWYQRVSFMAQKGMISKKHLREMWGLSFIKVWDHFKLFIEQKREENGENKNKPFSRKHFQEIVNNFKKKRP